MVDCEVERIGGPTGELLRWRTYRTSGLYEDGSYLIGIDRPWPETFLALTWDTVEASWDEAAVTVSLLADGRVVETVRFGVLPTALVAAAQLPFRGGRGDLHQAAKLDANAVLAAAVFWNRQSRSDPRLRLEDLDWDDQFIATVKTLEADPVLSASEDAVDVFCVIAEHAPARGIGSWQETLDEVIVAVKAATF